MKEFIDQNKVIEKEDKAYAFENFIELDKTLIVDEAIEKLKTFHNVKTQVVLDTFLNLKKISEKGKGVVIFEKSISNGNPCINMECRDENGNWISNSLIDIHTGQPIEHIG